MMMTHDEDDNNDNDDGGDKEQNEDDNGRGDGIMEDRPVSLTLLLGCCSQIEGCPTYDLWDSKKNFQQSNHTSQKMIV